MSYNNKNFPFKFKIFFNASNIQFVDKNNQKNVGLTSERITLGICDVTHKT